MPKLYEISRDIERVIETGFSWDDETGEVTFDAADLDALRETLAEKLEGCGRWLKGRKALASAMRDEERALRARRLRVEREIEWLERYVLSAIDNLPGGKLETPAVALSRHRAQAVVVDDERKLPDEFVTRVETVKVDRLGLRKALKAGEVAGAHMETREHLRVR